MPVLAVVLLMFGLSAYPSLPPPGPAFGWPVSSPRVVRRFEPPPEPWLAGHRGVDLAAPPGTPVRASGDGVVRFAGVLFGRGVVSVAHPGGLRTTYEPVTSNLQPGDRVRAGDVIGTLGRGHSGCPEAACLHWGLRRGDRYLDPLVLLGFGRVRLLPLAGRSAPSRVGGGRRFPGPTVGLDGGSQARGWAWRNAARRRSVDTWV